MSASTAGALKAVIEGAGLGISAFRDKVPARETRPYVTIDESISFTPDPTSTPFDHSADPPWFREEVQVNVWQDWRRQTGASFTLLESPSLPYSVAKAIHGVGLPTAPTKVYGVWVKNVLRIVEVDNNIVHHVIMVEVARDA
jgi:hypothetical protein